MMRRSYKLYFISPFSPKFLISIWTFLIALFIVSCSEEKVSTDSSLRLSFSADTVRFDTVFTTLGSSTQAVMVYNPNRYAVKIRSVSVSTDYFQLNLDGENDRTRLHDITLNGKDSLFLFIRATIDPQDVNTPVFLTDSVFFLVNGNEQRIILEAYGQNVQIIRSSERLTRYNDFHFTAERPYLVFDTVEVMGQTDFDAGATLYMHAGTSLYLHGPVKARGTLAQPVRITGDRLDRLFPKVPYQMASGQWGGVYISGSQSQDSPDSLIYTEILSGNVGLFIYADNAEAPRSIVIGNARIHNHARYGVVMQNAKAEIYNTEISNCASYCLFLSGGQYLLTHNTIASYFGYPYSNLNIHTTGREDVPAVYVNLIDSFAPPASVRFYNNVITGARMNNLVFDTVYTSDYDGEFANNYVLADTLNAPWAHDNVYADKKDTVFVNTHYLHGEYKYFDFRLDTVSPARGVGNATYALPYPNDRLGIPRISPIDAGCYQFQP